jgi:hypothetical protein
MVPDTSGGSRYRSFTRTGNHRFTRCNSAARSAAVMYAGLTAIVLLYLVCWSIVRGIGEIVAAIEFRKVIQSEWLLGFAGVGSIVW